jgi:hypothetical protein
MTLQFFLGKDIYNHIYLNFKDKYPLLRKYIEKYLYPLCMAQFDIPLSKKYKFITFNMDKIDFIQFFYTSITKNYKDGIYILQDCYQLILFTDDKDNYHVNDYLLTLLPIIIEIDSGIYFNKDFEQDKVKIIKKFKKFKKLIDIENIIYFINNQITTPNIEVANYFHDISMTNSLSMLLC